VDKNIQVKIVSTKYRNIRTIEITPRSRSAGNSDAMGLLFRKERYDEVFDTYFPISDIQNNSPIKKAGIR
jgi:CRISPR/Cas system-associated protein Cas5 (RAMP superfamily)